MYLDTEGLRDWEKKLQGQLEQTEELFYQIRLLQETLYGDPLFSLEAPCAEILTKLTAARRQVHFIRDSLDSMDSAVKKIAEEGAFLEQDQIQGVQQLPELGEENHG